MLTKYLNNVVSYQHREYNNGQFKIQKPEKDNDSIVNWQVKNFFTKQPNTVYWLSTLSEDSIFWDVGSNIGIYSVWAAHKSKCKKIFAFEPSYINYNFLCKNIELNNYNKKIFPINAVLYFTDGLCETILNNKNPGANQIKYDYHSTNPNILTFSPNTFIEKFQIELPTHLRINLSRTSVRIFDYLDLNSLQSLSLVLRQSNVMHLKILYDFFEMGFGVELRDIINSTNSKKLQIYPDEIEIILTRL